MSIASIARPDSKLSGPARRDSHRFWIMIGAVAGIAVTLALCIYGFEYYILSSSARLVSTKHAALKPSGRIGHGLGIVGGGMLALMFLYPLRKRWKWLSRKGKTKHWLDYHILMGLVAPVLVTFHSAFKLHGIAGLAYWMMVAVVVSGIVGRYFYGRIPRKLDQVEMSMVELEEIRADLARQIHDQKVLSPEELVPLLALPPIYEVQTMPLPKALLMIIRLDLRRSWLSWRLRQRAGSRIFNNAELRQALAAVRRHAALTKDALFLSRMQRLFRLWHIIHRPFSYSLVLLALLHVFVVMFLGYF